jgi:hypothetical protein
MLDRPLNVESWSISYLLNYDGQLYMNPILLATIHDIFRKLDLKLSRTLDINELNGLGYIANIPTLLNLTQDTFDKTFKSFSWTENGLTLYGFK